MHGKYVKLMNYTKIDLYSYLYNLLLQIPDGMVSTYGDLAVALGDKISARAVGYMLSLNNYPDKYPCYKIVYSDGTAGNYALGAEEKIRRLKNDGINVINGKIDNFNKLVFRDFKSDYPLKKLMMEQNKISGHIDTNDYEIPKSVAAVDVSYVGRYGYGAMVIKEGDNIVVRYFKEESKFPYIPGYLGYHETPYIENLVRDFDGIILIDGNGILHPRMCGLATFYGVLFNKQTIGVAKSLLLGDIGNNYIYYNNKPLGYQVNKRTIVSPGNKIGLEKSVEYIKSIGNGKYPQILQMAHNETVKFRKSGDCRDRTKAMDSGSISAGIRGFESPSPHF
jgi:deoxyribonuclease V